MEKLQNTLIEVRKTVEANYSYCKSMMETCLGIEMDTVGAKYLLSMLVAGRFAGLTDPDEALKYYADFCGGTKHGIEAHMRDALLHFCGAITWRDVYRAFTSEVLADEDGVSAAEGG